MAVLAAAAMLLAACTAAEDGADDEPDDPEPVDEAPDAADDRSGGTLRLGLSIDPGSIDPRFVVDDEGELVVDALFDPLVRLDEQFRVVPAAAERWTIDEDGRELTFHLAEATFHDGTPVTAHDFVRTFDRIADGTADPPSFLAHLLAPVEGSQAAQEEGAALDGVEAVDDDTLVIRLSEAQPGFLRTLTNPSLVPTPEAADEDVEEFGLQPVGNGPFAMAEPREPDAFLRLSRFADHPEPALLDEVLIQIYHEDPDRDRQWEDLVDGQLHVAEVPPERLAEARRTFGTSPDGYRGPGVLNGITSTVYLYGFDVSREPFDDPAVRRAISLSIDRQALADDVMQGTRAPATSLVPPPFPGSQRGECDHCRYDPDAARALLEEAGVALDGFTLAHNRGRTHAAIAERMASDLEEALDIDVDLESEDLRPFVQAVRAGEFPVFRLGWQASEPDPGAYLQPLFHSDQIGLDNLSRYASEEVDELLDDARGVSDDEALELYAEAERIVLDDAPVLPLLWYRHSHVVAEDVRGLVWSPLGRINLSRVWLAPTT